jgi:gamma-D-glutamyl-L-lysine dipeptidyl-peptidase
MHFGICPLSVVPVRNSPSHRSEMVSQLLFGELVEILEEKGKQWSRVRCDNDNFVGWVESSQVKRVTPTEFEHYQQHFAFSLELVQPVMGPDHFIPVTMGARLPDFDGIRFKLGDTTYTFSGQALSIGDFQPSSDLILKLAKRYLHTPYLWGGRSPFGIDSSGLVQMVYNLAGFRLPREPQQQLEVGETIDFIEYSQVGDIAFFENNNGRITHSGILMPNGQIIHANGGVRIDLVDHYGIFDDQKKYYTRRLRLIKRILPTIAAAGNNASQSVDVRSKQIELF